MIFSFVSWNVDPVAFTVPGLNIEVRWYGLAFALGFLLSIRLLSVVWKKEQINNSWLEKLFYYVFFGLLIGARVGHCLFYDPAYYLSHPFEFLKVWEGGLSSHGGALGIIVAIYIYSKKVTRKSMLWTLDRLVLPAGFMGALIRTGNLMNSEIYGHPTTLPWGFNFLRSEEWYLPPINQQPCHPTQIYEALCYILASLLCWWLYWKKDYSKNQGFLFGFFIAIVFISRFIIEFYKNNQEAFEDGMVLDMGQLLSIPFILVGCWFIYKSKMRDKQQVHNNKSKK